MICGKEQERGLIYYKKEQKAGYIFLRREARASSSIYFPLLQCANEAGWDGVVSR